MNTFDFITELHKRFPDEIHRVKMTYNASDFEDFIIELSEQKDKEIKERIESYFKGLVVIPDPQATKNKLLDALLQRKENK